MDTQDEIRQSQIEALSNKVARRNYGRYLIRMKLLRIRSFVDREIAFDFPVTALVGPNGGGKTTVLGAAGLIYQQVPPRRFFAKSGKYDSSMQNWRVEYELLDRTGPQKTGFTRTASYRKAKWNRDAVERKVLIFGVTRTVPASERRELARCISGGFRGYGEQTLNPSVVEAVEAILGKEAANYLTVHADRTGKVSLYAAKPSAGGGYSEFHFGAGEASVIRIASQIEQAEDNSLILIEEIENGLHPVATRRLVEYLIDVARRKSTQVIFTTHSNDALGPLPSNAVWAAYNGTLTQGKLDIAALRTLTGRVEARLAIFVEDAFAEEVVWAALRAYNKSSALDLKGIKVHHMGGAGTAEKATRYHNANPSIHFPAVCILDGDRRPSSAEEYPPNTSYLPGENDPEAYIFDQVFAKLDVLAARLSLMMQLPPADQERVRTVVRERRLTNYDRHVIYSQIGEDLDFTSQVVVQRAFINAWTQSYPDDIKALWGPIEESLPKLNEPAG